MQIFVKVLRGNPIMVEVSSILKVKELKDLLVREHNAPWDSGLYFDGSKMKSEKTLHECGIKEGDTIHIVARARGGSIYLSS